MADAIRLFFRRLTVDRIRHWLSPSRLMVLSFAILIFVGAVLLHLPASNASGESPESWVDSLFMSTSAVCVTGLITRSTPDDYTFSGQVILLCLFQIGGIGILTFSNLVFLRARKRATLGARMIVEETHGILPHIRPEKLVRRIFTYTFSIEAIGIVFLIPRFAMDMPFLDAVWCAIFHTVSAFCNAGFSLFNDSLIRYADDPVVNAVIMGEVALGGLGFVVYADLMYWFRNCRNRPHPRLSLHSKLILSCSAILLVAGFLLFAGIEAVRTVDGKPAVSFWQAMFMSVVSRTAGFNTIAVPELSNASLVVVMILMFIGGSPGSTAGGIKTSTFAILHFLTISRIQGKHEVQAFGRRIPEEAVAKALAVTACYTTLVVAGVIVLQVTEHLGKSHAEMRTQFLDEMFEVVSALGTVGLSTGITSSLTSGGKLVIIVLMYLGRLGPLLVAGSFIGRHRGVRYGLPEEPVITG